MKTAQGESFTVNIVEVHQDRMDNEKVEALLTPEQLKSCKKTISFNQTKTTRHTGKKADFVMPKLDNATPEGLADMLGRTREEIKDLQKLEGIYKEALEARLRD